MSKVSKQTMSIEEQATLHLENLVDKVVTTTETTDTDGVVEIPEVVKNMLNNMPWYAYKQMMYCKDKLDKIHYNFQRIEEVEPNSIDLEKLKVITDKWESQYALWKFFFDLQEVCFVKINKRRYDPKDLEDTEQSFKRPKAKSNYKLEQELTA